MASTNGNVAELKEQVTALDTTLTAYMETTDAKIEELSGTSSDGLKDYIDNIIIELSGIDEESGEVNGDTD